MGIDASLFVSDEVQTREVELADGSKYTFWFKEVPSSKFRKWRQGGAVEADLISQVLCNEDGTPALTFAQADALKTRVSDSLFIEALAVCGFGEKKETEAKKDLPPEETTGSGSS